MGRDIEGIGTDRIVEFLFEALKRATSKAGSVDECEWDELHIVLEVETDSMVNIQ